MRLKLTRFLLLAALLCGAVPAFAQGGTLPNTYEVDWAGITFNYADGWQVNQNDQGSIYLASGDDIELFPDWYTGDILDGYGVALGDARSVIQELLYNPTDSALAFDPTAIQTIDIDGQQMLTYEFADQVKGGSYTTVLAAFSAPSGTVFTGRIYPVRGTEIPAARLGEALQTVASFREDETGAVAEPAADYVFEESGIGVVLPDGWEVVVEDNGFVRFESDATYFDPYWYYADDVAGVSAAGDVGAILEDVATNIGLPFDAATLETSDLNGRTLTTASYEDTFTNNNVDYTGVLAGMTLADGTVFVGDIYPAVGSEITELDLALDVVASARSGATVQDSPAAPAGMSQWFGLGDGSLGFFYPDDWTVETTDSGFMYLTNGVTAIDPYYAPTSDFIQYSLQPGDPGTMVMAILRVKEMDAGVNPKAFDPVTVNGTDLVTYLASAQDDQGTYEMLVAATELSDGTMVAVVAYPVSGEALTEGDLALEMLSTVALVD
ncbi:hypothetical protein [Aggregatilinea lenta]|uniref:hypothetical protein n=1 Tax=Aggregatilinea lenta TaxID=913108 RepID=UPI000E5BB174|nr:hypothetical protein [Aggregatilinea lenta]